MAGPAPEQEKIEISEIFSDYKGGRVHRIDRIDAVLENSISGCQKNTPENGASQEDGLVTQPVKPSDRKSGRIRIPQAAKKLFPETKTELCIRIRGGAPIRANYLPNDRDKARSGILSVGRAALDQLQPEEQLKIRFEPDGTVCLD